METIYQQTIKHILILEKTKGEDEVSNGMYHQSMYIISLFIDLKNIHFDYQSEKGNNLIDTCTKQTFLKLADSYTEQQLKIKDVQILLYNEALIFALETILEFHGSKPRTQKKRFENAIYKTTDISTLATLKQDLKRELIGSTGNADNDFVQHLDNRIEYIKEVGRTPHQPKKAKTPQQKEKEYTGKEYALTFILDRLSKGDRLIVGVKKELAEMINSKFKINHGKSIYSRYKEIYHFDFNKESILISIAGENWKETVLELSEYPNELEAYINKNIK